MKTPVCEKCAKTKELCDNCKQKLESGKISNLDVEISNLLYDLEGEYTISDVSFVKALDLEKVVLVLTDTGAEKLIGEQGKIVNEISKRLGKKVRIVEYSEDGKKTISEIIAPARVLGINQVYAQEGNKYKVRIMRKDIAKMPTETAVLENALESLLGEPVSIIFE